MDDEGTATKRHIRQKGILVGFLCFFVANFPLFAAEPQSAESERTTSQLDLELLSRGRPISPLVWRAFQPTPLPKVNSSNGPRVSSHIQQGKLALSLTEFLQLV